jgi:hypothetical protein
VAGNTLSRVFTAIVSVLAYFFPKTLSRALIVRATEKMTYLLQKMHAKSSWHNV